VSSSLMKNKVALLKMKPALSQRESWRGLCSIDGREDNSLVMPSFLMNRYVGPIRAPKFKLKIA
jgi:hypothetical protein